MLHFIASANPAPVFIFPYPCFTLLASECRPYVSMPFQVSFAKNLLDKHETPAIIPVSRRGSGEL